MRRGPQELIRRAEPEQKRWRRVDGWMGANPEGGCGGGCTQIPTDLDSHTISGKRGRGGMKGGSPSRHEHKNSKQTWGGGGGPSFCRKGGDGGMRRGEEFRGEIDTRLTDRRMSEGRNTPV